ncbi:hypothetical protein FRC17_008576 [Serendipita sp. 399]|nr:hypothetical protein FRC17_008576 [Serendipita sp. 399]
MQQQFVKRETAHLLERLGQSARLRGYVRRCIIQCLRESITQVAPHLADVQASVFAKAIENIFTLVGSFPSLESVVVHRVNMPFKWLFFLCNRPNILLDVVISAASVYDAVDLPTDQPFNLSSLMISTSNIRGCMPGIIQMTSLSSSLRVLSLDTTHTWTLKDLFEKHMQSSSISLPRLEILGIAWIDPEHFEFFRCTPNLLDLRFKMGFKLPGGTAPLPANLLPKLRRFRGDTTLFNTFIVGRPVTDIETRDAAEDDVPFDQFGSRFGSSADILSLTWDNCTRNRELLLYVSGYCPKIRHLNVTPTVPYLKEELEARLEAVKPFKELCSLRITSLQHVPTEHNLEWERHQCEVLTKNSPHLVSISFGALIDWSRKPDSKTWKPSGEGLPLAQLVRLPYKPGQK